MATAKLYRTETESPVGNLTLCSTESGICVVEFSDKKDLEKEVSSVAKQLDAEVLSKENQHLKALKKQLKEYFNGKREHFEVPLEMVGTDFQKKVWTALQGIPYGQVISYRTEAEKMGVPKSVRAVANANGQNKISIVIPCHRVIGSNGKLTGYGGGIWRKQKLLELEKALLF